MSSRLACRIVKMLEDYGQPWPGGAENAKISRTYAGCSEKAWGAWSWSLQPVEFTGIFPVVGSQWPATEVADPRKEVTIYRDPDGRHEFIVESEPFPPEGHTVP